MQSTLQARLPQHIYDGIENVLTLRQVSAIDFLGVHGLPPGALRPAAARGPGHSQRERRTASIIVTTLATAKIAANNKLPCENAKPQPPAAIRESPTSSRRPGSTRGGFISRLF